jgi:hypothetical protein
MNTADDVIDSLADMDRCVCLLAGARGAPDVVAALSEYLAAWPAKRVARIQRVDAGWASFDQNQQPMPQFQPADVHRICGAVHGQCMSLRGAGVTLTPEMLELDLFLSLACAKLAEFEPAMAPARDAPSAPRTDPVSHSNAHRGSGHPA